MWSIIKYNKLIDFSLKQGYNGSNLMAVQYLTDTRGATEFMSEKTEKMQFEGKYLYSATNHIDSPNYLHTEMLHDETFGLVIRNPDESSPLFGLSIVRGTMGSMQCSPPYTFTHVGAIPRVGRDSELREMQERTFGLINGSSGAWEGEDKFVMKHNAGGRKLAFNIFPKSHIDAPEYTLEQVLDKLRMTGFVSGHPAVRAKVVEVAEAFITGEQDLEAFDKELGSLAKGGAVRGEIPKSLVDRAARSGDSTLPLL